MYLVKDIDISFMRKCLLSFPSRQGNAPLRLAAWINMLIRGPLTLGQVAGPIH